MNAVEYFARALPPEAVRRVAAVRVGRFERAPGLLGDVHVRREVLDVDEAFARVVARWGDDLCGFLNALTRGELAALAASVPGAVPDASRAKSPELRAQLWRAGAALERGDAPVGDVVQPVPIVLGGHLVVQAAPRGMFPPSDTWPRPIPPSAGAAPPSGEPETLDDLLAAATGAIGVRLGARGRDKGAWGTRAAALLGVRERGDDEPDWRGDVEIKTVPVARDGAYWRVVEDPAIAMAAQGAALAKLQRTLWLARCDVGERDATIVSWYLLESDPEIARLARRYLHERPKGPAGTQQRGLYLMKRFFADAGLLATLNGPG